MYKIKGLLPTYITLVGSIYYNPLHVIQIQTTANEIHQPAVLHIAQYTHTHIPHARNLCEHKKYAFWQRPQKTLCDIYL